MGSVRITAEFVYTLDSEPIRKGFVEFDDADGRRIGPSVQRDYNQ